MVEPPRFEEVAAFLPLVAAARRAARGHRRSPEVAEHLSEIEARSLELEGELTSGAYQPRPYRTYRIVDPKPRLIAEAAFRDRVVHHALCHAIGPALEHDALPTSFACRVGGGTLRAVQAAQWHLRRHAYVLTLDVRHYFETASHEVLLRLVRRRVRDERLRWLVERFVRHAPPESMPGRGLPIGNLTSQHFANFMLGPLDRHITRGLRLPMVRYMDDVLVFADRKRDLWTAAASCAAFLTERLDLEAKDEATRVLPASEGVPFLGFRVFPRVVRFDGRRKRRWLRKMRRADEFATAAGSLAWPSGGCPDRPAEPLDGLAPPAAMWDARKAVVASLIGWSFHADTLGLRRSWMADGGRGYEAEAPPTG